jgi:hypothetical protein
MSTRACFEAFLTEPGFHMDALYFHHRRVIVETSVNLLFGEGDARS